MVLLWSIADLLSLNRRDLLFGSIDFSLVPPCNVKIRSFVIDVSTTMTSPLVELCSKAVSTLLIGAII